MNYFEVVSSEMSSPAPSLKKSKKKGNKKNTMPNKLNKKSDETPQSSVKTKKALTNKPEVWLSESAIKAANLEFELEFLNDESDLSSLSSFGSCSIVREELHLAPSHSPANRNKTEEVAESEQMMEVIRKWLKLNKGWRSFARVRCMY
jgi:hypothetical protein